MTDVRTPSTTPADDQAIGRPLYLEPAASSFTVHRTTRCIARRGYYLSHWDAAQDMCDAELIQKLALSWRDRFRWCSICITPDLRDFRRACDAAIRSGALQPLEP